ncbi:MAG: excinuclease ABC subunit UvrC [Treponema sp.]|jgi:excinuclease ABC subunit C|nr:excinuclease ABC subunit UvrC [Treponema sp.]
MVHDRYSENYSLLKDSARDAPSEPGVYIWRDDENRIIYVGKARVLRNRLASYFSGPKDVKTTALIRHSKSIETIIVSNEYEALLLENTLIKQHSPKYNINLKDGKTYPVVRVTAGDFPRVFRTRHIIEDGSLYFGPFPNVQALDKTLALIEKLFPLRKCRTFKTRKNPCMYYHINRCLAPCCGKVEEAAYKTQVDRVSKLLNGETSSLTIELTVQMHEAAAALRFEEAAGLRNAIQAIESLSENNSVADMDPENRDYIAWAAEGIFTTFSVLSMRGGRMTGRELFSSRSAAEEDESLDTFIAAYYSPDRLPPPRIFLMAPTKPVGGGTPSAVVSGSIEALNRYFTEQFGFSPELVFPSGETEKRHLAAIAMAHQNAQEELRRRLRERGAGPALDELARVLGLKTRPERIEGFDIAQLDGKHPVASLISFKNGVPDRKNYRHFKLRTVVGKVDDFASMREVVHRRYSRLVRENSELPDLILIDGGIGQVNAAKGVMDELGIDCDVAGLAKRDEEIWLPHASEPIKLSRRSEALKVLQFVRDETHRFATGLNQRLRSKDLYFPVLESIEGIGPKRAAAIMKTYGELEKIAAAEPEDIAEKCGITASAAAAVRAAARLALEDRNAKIKQFAAKSSTAAAALADEAFAAETPPDYE